jgi:very-short-patch-repair endonuclease
MAATLEGVDPRDALEALGGYATRRALLAAGVTRHALSVAVTECRVVRLRRGVYGLGLPDGIARLRAAAVALNGVVSHDAAAVLWGLEMVHEPGQRVTVARNRSRATFDGVRVTRADIDATEVRDGLRVTTVVRTLLDCAATLALDEAVVIVDSALRKGRVTPAELATAARGLRGRHATRVRAVMGLVDPRAESVLESLLRVLLAMAGLVPDESQYVIRDRSGRMARVDFAYLRARLVVEADGFEFHSKRADYRRDRQKSNLFCRLDWSLLRFTWEDVRFAPDDVVEAVRVELSKPPRRQRAARQLTRGTQRAA